MIFLPGGARGWGLFAVGAMVALMRHRRAAWARLGARAETLVEI